MGTRSILNFWTEGEDSKIFATVYRQFDGYPTGMGADIKAIFAGKYVVNGYSNPETQINGMHCAAAMAIAGLKTGCGNVYLYAPETSDMWEDYTYDLGAYDRKLMFRVRGHGEVLYSGPLEDFDPEKPENGIAYVDHFPQIDG